MKLTCKKFDGSTKEIHLLPNKDGSGLQFIDLTDGHIAPCKFESKNLALSDFFSNYLNKYLSVRIDNEITDNKLEAKR